MLLGLALLASSGCSKNSRALRLLQAANRDFAAEKYDDAEVEYKNLLMMRASSSPLAIGQLGLIYLKEGRGMDAYPYLAEAGKRDPDSLPIQLGLAQLYSSARDTSNTTRIAVHILTAQPTNEEALLTLINGGVPAPAAWQQVAAIPGVANNLAYHIVLAQVEMSEKKYGDASNDLHLALSANPKSSEAYFELAELRSLQKQEKEAGEAFQTAAAYSPLRSMIRIRFIDYLVQTGRSEEASKALAELQDKAPDFVPGWISAMNIALSQRRVDDASKYAETILSRDPRNFQGLLGKGTVALAKGETSKAITTFEHMNSLYKTSPQAKYQLALAETLNHDKVKAIALLNAALALEPSYTPANLLLAQLDIRSGDPASAIALMTQFLNKNRGTVQAYVLLAEAYVTQKNPEAALAVYRNLAKILPKNPQIALMTGMVLNTQRKHALARAEFEKALALSPGYAPAIEQLVNLDIVEHKFNDAFALAKGQIDKYPKAAEPWELMAKIDMAQKNLATAQQALLKAIDLNPNLTAPYLLLAQVYVSGTNYQQALDKLNALVAKTNDVAAYLQIGAIQDQLKQYEPARDAYEKALAANPKSPPALNNLAYIYAVNLGKTDRAYELAQRAREILPYDPHVEDTLGWVLFKRGDYARSLSMLEESADREPADPEIQYHLGMAHYMMDEEDSARVALHRAVATPQDYVNKDEARNVLALLDSESSGSPAATLAAMEKELKLHPNDPVLLNRIGALQEQLGELQQAAATYEQALKQTPDAVHIMARLARVYALGLDKPDKAMSLATDAHKTAPENAEVDSILGHLVFQTGDYSWALSLLQNAADQIPNDPQLYYDLAWAKYSVGQINEARVAIQKTLADEKFARANDAKLFLTMIDGGADPAKARAAAPEAQKALQANPKYVPALMVMAAAQEAAGNFAAAKDACAKALAIFPTFAPAARQLAMLDARHFPDDAAGYATAEKARTAYPDDAEVAEALGILSYHQSKYSRSAELLQEGMAKSGEDGVLDFYLGMDYYQLKRNADSRNALGRALGFKIPDPMAAEAKKTLAALK
jgi:tetratricopeptide (TPR) repeat protein